MGMLKGAGAIGPPAPIPSTDPLIVGEKQDGLPKSQC